MTMTWLQQGVTCCAVIREKMKGIGGQRESQQLSRLGPHDHPGLEAHPTKVDRRNTTALTQKTFLKAGGCAARSEPTSLSALTSG